MAGNINNLFASDAFQRFNLCLITNEVENTECLGYKKKNYFVTLNVVKEKPQKIGWLTMRPF